MKITQGQVSQFIMANFSDQLWIILDNTIHIMIVLKFLIIKIYNLSLLLCCLNLSWLKSGLLMSKINIFNHAIQSNSVSINIEEGYNTNIHHESVWARTKNLHKSWFNTVAEREQLQFKWKIRCWMFESWSLLDVMVHKDLVSCP